MMEANRSQQLEQIVLLSREMLAKAADHEWARVAEVDARRRQMVMRFFQQPAQRQDVAGVAAAIKEILRLNQEITDLGRRYQDRLGTEIHSNRLGRTASAAYLGHAR
jgi:hypothetical protein